MPRKPKLTKKVLQALVEARRARVPNDRAANFAGVGKSAYYKWIQDGTADRDAGRKTLKAELVEGLEKAEADAMAESLVRIREAAKGGKVVERKTVTKTDKDGNTTTTTHEKVSQPQWTADAWLLERRHPDLFGMRNRVELTGRDGGAVEILDWGDVMRLASKAEQEET